MNWNRFFVYKDGKLYKKPVVMNDKDIGCHTQKGYRSYYFKGKQYIVHRTIYEMHHGKIAKGMLIDHIDGNPRNNRIENLRMVTPSENQRNCKRKSNNKSGVTGLFWLRQNGRWRVQLNVKGKIHYLGCFRSKTEAIKVRKDAEKRLGFHPNHGRD